MPPGYRSLSCRGPKGPGNRKGSSLLPHPVRAAAARQGYPPRSAYPAHTPAV